MALQPVADTDDDDDLVDPSQAKRYRELPVYGAPMRDRKWSVDYIIGELDQGQYVNAGVACDSVLRDARVLGALEQRNAGLFCAPLELQAADESTLANEIRDEVERNWESMFPRPVLEDTHQYGVLAGIAVAQKEWRWEPSGRSAAGRWIFRVSKVLHPRYYQWRWDKDSYFVMTLEQGLVRIPRRSTEWLVHAPYGYDRAYLRGRLRALLDPVLARSWTKNDWAHFNEAHGHPLKKAIIPQMADPKQATEFINSIAKMGSNTTIKTRQDADGNKYDIEYVEASGQGWKSFEGHLAWTDKEISLIILGQAASTDGQGGLSSTEKPGDSVRSDIKAADSAKLCETLYSQALREYCEFNYGNADLAPRPHYAVEPDEDELKAAQAFAAMATADKTYIDCGVLTPEEVAISRSGEGRFAEYTALDVEARQRILSTSLEQLEVSADTALELAKNPPPPVTSDSGVNDAPTPTEAP